MQTSKQSKAPRKKKTELAAATRLVDAIDASWYEMRKHGATLPAGEDVVCLTVLGAVETMQKAPDWEDFSISLFLEIAENITRGRLKQLEAKQDLADASRRAAAIPERFAEAATQRRV